MSHGGGVRKVPKSVTYYLQTIAVTPLHVTALQYSLLFLVFFGVFDSFFGTVIVTGIVTGIKYKIFDVFTQVLSYFLKSVIAGK